MFRKRFITTGIILPKEIRIDCFEKNPEVLNEYFSKDIKPIASIK